MRAKLSRRSISNLQPQERPYECRDTELKGFLIRVQPSGRMAWFYQYRTVTGKQTRLKLGDYPGLSPDGARRVALGRAAEAARGVDLVERKRATRLEGERLRTSTLSAFLIARYEPWARAHLKSGDFQIARLRSDFADHLDKPMSAFNAAFVEAERQKWRKTGLSPRSINRDMQRLQGVLSRAVEWGVLSAHPFTGTVKPMKVDKTGRVRFLSPEEEVALRRALVNRDERLIRARTSFNVWRGCRGRKLLPERSGVFLDHLHPMTLLSLNTGLRRGELLSLKWQAVNFSARLLTVVAASAKSGNTRRIPLNVEALHVLSAWRERHPGRGGSDLVFPSSDGRLMLRIDTSWRSVVVAAGLVDFRFHDLRHSFASKLVQAGIDLYSVKELLGHSEIAMTERYAHLAPDGLARAVAAI